MSGLELTGWQIFGVLCALAAPLSVAFIALIGRLNDPRADNEGEDAHPPHGNAPARPAPRRSRKTDMRPDLIHLARIKGAIYRAWRINLFRLGGISEPLPGHIWRRMGAE